MPPVTIRTLDSGSQSHGGRAFRLLGWCWAVLLVGIAGGAAALQMLGPPMAVAQAPPVPPPVVVAEAQTPASEPVPAANIVAPVAVAAAPLPPALKPPPRPGGAIALPDPALEEPSEAFQGGVVPRIGPDGAEPMRVYAAGYDAADRRPRIAILFGGIGMSELDSAEAVRALPAAVSLAVSPYGAHLDSLLNRARAAGHELLVALPMEPQGYPLQDAGNLSLMTGLTQAANAHHLDWALSRFAGYVGATGALGPMRGERFAASEGMAMVLETLARRGLLYVDPRPGATTVAAAALPPLRDADLVIDEQPGRGEIEAHLARLEQIARDRGVAIGLIGAPMPVTTARLAAWSTTLAQRGFQLVPVSAVVAPRPATAAASLTLSR